MDKGHGRLETRELTSTTMLNGYLTWPDVGQVFELRRRRVTGDEVEEETAYGITSLGRQGADAETILGLVRQHWGIENKLHYVRDETLGEDRCRARKGSTPQVLAAIRNVAVFLLDKVEAASNAAATRRFAAHPEEAVALIH